MFAKMSNKNANGLSEAGASGGEDASPPPAAAAPKPKAKKDKQTIEETYQKMSQLEHILLRPDTYIGSIEQVQDMMWVYDTEAEKMVQREIKYVPGLYKIFDEILVNAADNKQRDPKMDCIKIKIDQEQNTISVWNNGKGIPVAMHKNENMFVPTMIFGHLLTSSNYNDEEQKVTGGRNGYGAKLCNIFSTKFVVETACREYKKQFKQTWTGNMGKASEPKISEFHGDDFTRITFSPDLSKFGMESLDDDIVSLMSRRAFDVCASTRGVKVFLNNTKLPVKSFKDYIQLYTKDMTDASGNNLKIVYEQHDRWEVAMTVSDRGLQQMSFVNSIATTKGGRHVEYILDMIAKKLGDVLKKKNKGGADIKPYQIKNHVWLFVNCLIVNPTFDSQTKENMTSQVKSFGSKCPLSDSFITQVTKSGIVEAVLTWAKFKAQTELAKTSGGKKQKLKGVPKLEDANEAGRKFALKCTLILTEGDSAKALAVSGLGVIGRDFYGVFPLRGKLLNVREATHKQILENAEINNLVKIIGLQYKKKYNTVDDMKSLRYGKVMIMTDQDQDGSHIKGLLINFIHHNWPELLRLDFLEEFITPIVKARKKKEELSFYSLPEFEEWKSNTPNNHTYKIKYYKGLGTSSSKEAKEYFSNMDRHRIRFRYSGQSDDDHILLAFSKKHVDNRKEWLTNFMEESRRRKEFGFPEKYLYEKNTKAVSYTDFINLELVLFSNADNIRSIPSMVDGFKPGQRKVLFTCIKRNIVKNEIKVAQLAGSVAENSAYHHGEVSLCMTIVNLAQNFVGSNNLNLLEPLGQFGTRLTGGKDSASPRYLFTKMSPLTRLIFHPHDDPLLKHEYDDNLRIEPVWYIPIIPMVLVNGADGIGTGWMTKIPNYNPRDLVQCIRAMLDDEEPPELRPWYKNFKGLIEYCGDGRYVCSGEVALIDENKLEITELPVGTWTQNYKESLLEPLASGSEKVKAIVSDYKEYNTDTTVKFIVTIVQSEVNNVERDGFHKVFKLQTLINTSSMCVFDELGCLKKFDNVMDIVKNFYTLRLKYYKLRKDYLEGELDAQAKKLSNQARFIMEKCSGKLTVENKKRKTIVDELIAKGYMPDPIKEWQKAQEELEPEEPEEHEGEDEDTADDEEAKPIKKKNQDSEMSDVKKFDYLLGMSMWMLTDERKNELLKQRDNTLAELEVLRKKTHSDLWREDLDAFMEKLDEVEQKEREEELGIKRVKKTADKSRGKKKIGLVETMPSPNGQRIAPTITEDIKKKIQNAQKIKDNKIKKAIKREEDGGVAGVEIEIDEFDRMVKGNGKTLLDKIRDKNKQLTGKDGLKQTKLNFTKKTSENGSPKKGASKKKKSAFSDSDEGSMSSSDSDEDDDFSVNSPVSRERTESDKSPDPKPAEPKKRKLLPKGNDKKAVGPAKKKQKKTSGDEFDVSPQKKTKSKPKKWDDSDDDFQINDKEESRPSSPLDDSMGEVVKSRGRPGRAAARAVYVFDSDESE